MSSKTTTSGRSRAAASSSLRTAQAISSAVVGRSDSPSSAARTSHGTVRFSCEHVAAPDELLDDLDDGPVGDALAVGKAAPLDDRRVDRGENSRSQPRLADTGGAEQREEGAGARRTVFAKASSKQRQLVRAPDHRRVEPPRHARCVALDRDQPPSARPGSCFPFSSQRLDLLDRHRVPHERARLSAEQNLARRGAPAAAAPPRSPHRLSRIVPPCRYDLASVDAVRSSSVVP